MSNRKIDEFEQELHNILTDYHGRHFIYLLLCKCGIDVTSNGIPSVLSNDYEQGKRKIGLDIFNEMLYNETELLVKIINEHKTSNPNEGDN